MNKRKDKIGKWGKKHAAKAIIKNIFSTDPDEALGETIHYTDDDDKFFKEMLKIEDIICGDENDERWWLDEWWQ